MLFVKLFNTYEDEIAMHVINLQNVHLLKEFCIQKLQKNNLLEHSHKGFFQKQKEFICTQNIF